MNWQTTPKSFLNLFCYVSGSLTTLGTLWEEASYLHNRSCNIIFVHSFILSYRYKSISLLTEGTLLIPGETKGKKGGGGMHS